MMQRLRRWSAAGGKIGASQNVDYGLTTRETEILEDLSNDQIAGNLLKVQGQCKST